MSAPVGFRDALRRFVPPWLSAEPVERSTQSRPKILSIVPFTGPNAGGTVITITGEDLQPGALVRINGALATSIVVGGPTSLTCATPAGISGAQEVTVQNPDGGADAMGGGFVYGSGAVAPTLTIVAPVSGPAVGGTPMTLTGSGFVSGATVTVDGTPATSVVVVNATTITCVAPAGAPGAKAVRVTNPSTLFGELAGAFTHVAAPTATSIGPTSGPAAGGTSATITGTGFLTGAGVTIGGISASSVVVVNSTTITCVTPAGAPGAQLLRVTNTDGQFGDLAAAFTYIAAPVIASVTGDAQADSAGGDSIIINGTALGSATGVTWGGTACTITGNTSGTVTVTLPAKAAGSHDLAVTTAGGVSAGFAVEAWAPTDDPNCTLLFDGKHTPYDPVTGLWAPRFSIALANSVRMMNLNATITPALNGGPNFDGDGLGAAGLISEYAGRTWGEYLGPDVGGFRAGSLFGVYSSTTAVAISTTIGYQNPSLIGAMRTAGTLGLGAGTVSGVPKAHAHSYDGAYKVVTADVPVSGLYSALARIGNGVGTIDLSINGALAGGGYGQTATGDGHQTSFTGYPITSGTVYDSNPGGSSQLFAGNGPVMGAMKAKASNTFATKFYQWARRRHGVA